MVSTQSLNKFVFSSYITNGLSLEATLSSFKKTFPSENQDYSRYITNLYSRFKRNTIEKNSGFRKLDNFRASIIDRFVRNESLFAFLPQPNIAKALGISQPTVSRYLKQMVNLNYLVLIKIGSSYTNKASEYKLGSEGIALFNIMKKTLGSIKKIYASVKEFVLQKEESFDFDKSSNNWISYKGIPYFKDYDGSLNSWKAKWRLLYSNEQAKKKEVKEEVKTQEQVRIEKELSDSHRARLLARQENLRWD